MEEEDQLNPGFLENCAKYYRPAQVIIEFNGTWDLARMMGMPMPKGWEIDGVYSTVNAQTMELYLTNMRKMFIEQLMESELIVVNRCNDGTNRAQFRRTIKVTNPAAQLIFEHENGEILPQGVEDLPYDWNSSCIELDPMDYGIWYADAAENPERYEGKTLGFLAQIYTDSTFPDHTFVPGRFVMTCCIQDAQFLGFVCRYQGELPGKRRDWVHVTVQYKYEYNRVYREKGPVLYLKEIERAEKPAEDPVPIS